MKEFQEIFLSGGTIEFKKEINGHISIEYESNNSLLPISIFQVCVSLDGKVLETVPFANLGQDIIYPQPSLMVLVISDREGMFGRSCPKCHTYFRIDSCPTDQFCPYCGYFGCGIFFLTENQLKYIETFCKFLIDVYKGGANVILNLDKIAEDLPENRPKWVYSEEQQQNSYKCKKCDLKFDILGEYGLCPKCGITNLNEVFENKLAEIEREFIVADKQFIDRSERAIEWEKLTRCISDFESMANQLRRYLLRFPATPQRKNELQTLSFQNIVTTNKLIQEWFGFKLLDGLPEDDYQFLNRMFNRRHLFIHNAGRVDQEYIDNTNDTTVRLNQVLTVRSKEIRRLIPLIRACGQRLILGYESIS